MVSRTHQEKQKEDSKIIKIRSEKGKITTHNTEIQKDHKRLLPASIC